MRVTAKVMRMVFQSTPPRRGRPDGRRITRQASSRIVSIHAPAKGAQPTYLEAVYVSIHAPAKGATTGLASVAR